VVEQEVREVGGSQPVDDYTFVRGIGIQIITKGQTFSFIRPSHQQYIE